LHGGGEATRAKHPIASQNTCKGDSACVAMALYFLSHSFIPSWSFLFASNRLDASSLQLSDNSNNEDGFHVERKLGNNGIFSFVATVGPNETFYTDDNLDDNTTYCYSCKRFQRYWHLGINK